MDNKNNDNKSLILYTSLIFGVAIVMIIVSFFTQKHLDDLRVSEVDAQNVTLSNKAAQVSEENMQLVELNKTLREKNTELLEENEKLTKENEALGSENKNYEALVLVYDRLLNGRKTTARTLLKEIYTQDLTPEQKELYDQLVKRTN